MTYSVDWLLEQIAQGHRIDYLFFWGHRPWNPKVIDKSCLSQWWPADFTVSNQVYPTAEHWMMSEKANLFGDSEIMQAILASSTPAEVKKLGQLVRGFEQKIWDAHKYEIVKTGNMHKFSQHKDMTEFLVSTVNKVLVEASPVDFVWGIGLPSYSPAAKEPILWRGQNMLGFALMEVRDQLQQA